MGLARGSRYLHALELASEQDTTLTEYHYDPVTDELVVRESQDVEPILDFCLEAQVHNPSGRTRLGKYLCEVPNVIAAKWMREPSRRYPKGFNVISGRCNCSDDCSCPNDKHSAQLELRERLRDYSKIRTSGKARDRVGAGWGL